MILNILRIADVTGIVIRSTKADVNVLVHIFLHDSKCKYLSDFIIMRVFL